MKIPLESIKHRPKISKNQVRARRGAELKVLSAVETKAILPNFSNGGTPIAGLEMKNPLKMDDLY